MTNFNWKIKCVSNHDKKQETTVYKNLLQILFGVPQNEETPNGIFSFVRHRAEIQGHSKANKIKTTQTTWQKQKKQKKGLFKAGAIDRGICNKCHPKKRAVAPLSR